MPGWSISEKGSRVRVRAARGAIVVETDHEEDVLGSTQRLLEEMIERNEVATDDLVSILFTATEDIRSAFPAEAARRIGLGLVPLLCAREISVAGAMPSVVRVLMHFHTERGLREVVHVYLDGAEALRDDLEA
jgi:chorismate mutase